MPKRKQDVELARSRVKALEAPPRDRELDDYLEGFAAGAAAARLHFRERRYGTTLPFKCAWCDEPLESAEAAKKHVGRDCPKAPYGKRRGRR